MIAKLHAPLSFVTTRRLSRARLGRVHFLDHQEQALNRWLVHSVPNVAAFADATSCLAALPVMDKSQLMANFARYNTAGITAEQVRTTLDSSDRIGGLTVGASTGTSGNQGLFIISDAERFRWLGSILAKTMADLLWRKQKVAILLPRGTGLYDSANQIQRLQLRFFDVTRGVDALRAELEAFDPSVIVAPPKVLRVMAEDAFNLRPLRVFSAAETLDPIDRPIIEAGFGVPLGQIYMATEGLLGVTCRHGRLHLAEDSVHFEFEAVANGLVTPLISSFRRETQILARYRMNDLLRLDPEPCPCGTPLQAVSEIAGRMDDCFHLQSPRGVQMITPDMLRNAVVMADHRITDFRLIQTGPDAVSLALPTTLPQDAGMAAMHSLTTLFERHGVKAKITETYAPIILDVTRKLRRVEYCVPPGTL
ncbi:MAG: F390 synthetase-related protein [Pseudoruegeria sp.]